ncbi:MAG: hypothetical protein U0169_05415 [Polyangiaceae bacterium]
MATRAERSSLVLVLVAATSATACAYVAGLPDNVHLADASYDDASADGAGDGRALGAVDAGDASPLDAAVDGDAAHDARGDSGDAGDASHDGGTD